MFETCTMMTYCYLLYLPVVDPGFSRGGQQPGRGYQLLFGHLFSKLHANENILGWGAGTGPLDQPVFGDSILEHFINVQLTFVITDNNLFRRYASVFSFLLISNFSHKITK